MYMKRTRLTGERTFRGTIFYSEIEDYNAGQIVDDFLQQDFIAFYGKGILESSK